jgi:hypothetical protein
MLSGFLLVMALAVPPWGEKMQMSQRPLVECSFLIPVRRDKVLSDGGLHEPSTWDWFDNER